MKQKIIALSEAIRSADKVVTDHMEDLMLRLHGDAALIVGPIASLLKDSVSKAILSLGSVILAFFTDLAVQEIQLILLLIVIDAVTGIFAAWQRRERISSWGFRRTILKIAEYGFFLASVTAVAATYGELEWIRYWCFVFVALTEVYSIGENMVSPEVKALVKSLTGITRERIDAAPPEDTQDNESE